MLAALASFFLIAGPVEGTSGTYGVDVQMDDGTRAINVTWEGVAAGCIADNFCPGLMKRSWLSQETPQSTAPST